MVENETIKYNPESIKERVENYWKKKEERHKKRKTEYLVDVPQLISYVELSPSDRAICKDCGFKIFKDEPRGVRRIIRNKHYEYYNYCYKCTTGRLNRRIDYLKRDKKIFARLLQRKKSKRVILLKELGRRGENEEYNY